MLFNFISLTIELIKTFLLQLRINLYVLLGVFVTPNSLIRVVALNLLHIMDRLSVTTKSWWSFSKASFAKVVFKIALYF